MTESAEGAAQLLLSFQSSMSALKVWKLFLPLNLSLKIIFTFKLRVWKSFLAFKWESENHFDDWLTCNRENGERHWHSAPSRLGIGPENFGCLAGTHSQEHACPVWANTGYAVVYQAGWEHRVSSSSPILDVTSQRLIKMIFKLSFWGIKAM